MNLAWKELKYNKKNYILIELTIVLLIFMVIFLAGLTKGLEKASSSSLRKLPKEYFVLNKDAEGAIASSILSQELIDDLKSKDANGEAIAINRSYISTVGDSTKLDIAYFAIDTEGKLVPNVIEGSNKLEGNSILLSTRFKSKGVVLDDFIFDRVSEKYLKVVGFIADDEYSYTDVGYVSYETATILKKALNEKAELTYTTFITDNKDLVVQDDEEMKTKDEVINGLPGYSAQQKTIIMITWMLVLISASILGVFFYIITIQKKQQHGVMKALGMTNVEVSKVLVRQIVILSLIGVFIANVLSYLVSTILPEGLPFLVDYREILIVSVSFVAISIVSGLISVLRISKVDPLDIIGGVK